MNFSTSVENKHKKGTFRDYETVFCSPVVLMVLEQKIFKDLANFPGFSLLVSKVFRILEQCDQILIRATQGTFLQKINFLGIIVSERIFKEC
jgi:hypothetical protein